VIHHAEFNTVITFLGMICASVQAFTGIYSGYIRKKIGLLKINPVLAQSHGVFGNFATILYLLGLFAGIVGFIGAITRNTPPLELNSVSFNVHTWGSFPVLIVFVWKTWLSYFRKKSLYGKKKWLGIAMFLAWAFTWISAAISYYLRTLPSNLQHPDPVFLLPYRFMGAQLLLPFILGSLVGLWTVKNAKRWEKSQSS
jgi:hypothetical protein